MKVEIEVEEARELLLAVLDRLVDASLSPADKAALRKWRTKTTPGSEAMRELLAKMNADLSRALVNKKVSAVKKPDWR